MNTTASRRAREDGRARAAARELHRHCSQAADLAEACWASTDAFAGKRLIELASRGGVSWYRDWTLKWQHIEPKAGEMRWEIGDEQIGRVLKENVSVLPLLPPFPSADWNSEAPAGLSPTGYPGGD